MHLSVRDLGDWRVQAIRHPLFLVAFPRVSKSRRRLRAGVQQRFLGFWSRLWKISFPRPGPDPEKKEE